MPTFSHSNNVFTLLAAHNDKQGQTSPCAIDRPWYGIDRYRVELMAWLVAACCRAMHKGEGCAVTEIIDLSERIR